MWLATSASTDGCCERVLFATTGGSRARSRVLAVLFENKLHWFESQYQHIIFSF